MQKQKFVCDACLKDIGEKKHLSLMMTGSSTGVAHPPDSPKYKVPRWQVAPFQTNFVHFHNGECAKVWFNKELAKK